MDQEQSTSSAECKPIDCKSEVNVCESDFVCRVAENLYLDEETADIYILCEKDGQRVPAHKIFLKVSEVFHKEIFGVKICDDGETEIIPDMKKFNGEIKLQNTKKEVETFLQFFYKKNVELDIDNIVEIIILLNKHGMIECLETCGNFWAKCLSIDEVCNAYQWATKLKIKGLTQFLDRKVSANPVDVFNSAGFLTCPNYVVDHILSLELLGCRESAVLGACLAWARNACKRDSLDAGQTENLRKYLIFSEVKDGNIVEVNLLHKIRYSSLKIDEFFEQFGKNDDLFSSFEHRDIMRLIAGRSDLITDHFNIERTTLDNFEWSENKKIWCDSFKKLYSGLRSIESISATFSSNRLVLLGGLVLPNFFTKTEYEEDQTKKAKLYISETSIGLPYERSVLIDKKITLQRNNDTFINIHESPILIKPNFTYYICIPIEDGAYFLNFESKKQIRHNNQTIIELRQPLIIKSFCFNLF